MDPQDLEARVQKLEDWMQKRTAQQINFPLDIQSQSIIGAYFLSVVSSLDFTNVSGKTIPNLIIKQNNKQYVVSVQENLYLYTANSATDVLTVGLNITNGTSPQFQNNDQVGIQSTGTPPAPLLEGVPYYVVSASGNTLKLSASSGGAAIDITTGGTGTQYIQYFF